MNLSSLTPASRAVLHACCCQCGSAALAELQAALAAGGDANVRDPGEEQHTALIYAAVKDGCAPVIRCLLEHGADVAAQDALGCTALHYAAVRLQVEGARLLLAYGASPNMANHSGDTPLHLAMRFIRHHSFAELRPMLQLLLRHGGDVNACSPAGGSLLHCAVRRCEDPAELAPALRFLLAAGGDVNVADPTGCTPLHAAAGVGNMAAAQLFLRHGAEVDARAADGRTPLMHAASTHSVLMVAMLLLHGADVRVRDAAGHTAADHAAACHASADMLHMLTPRGGS